MQVSGVPVVNSLALKPLSGLNAQRSQTLQFEAIARRPSGSLATMEKTEPTRSGLRKLRSDPRGGVHRMRLAELRVHELRTRDRQLRRSERARLSVPEARQPRAPDTVRQLRSLLRLQPGHDDRVDHNRPADLLGASHGAARGLRLALRHRGTPGRVPPRSHPRSSTPEPDPPGRHPAAAADPARRRPPHQPRPRAARARAATCADTCAAGGRETARAKAGAASSRAPRTAAAAPLEPVSVPAILPTPTPPVEPIPPGASGYAQSPSAAERKEKAEKEASQSAFTTRPRCRPVAVTNGSEPSWYYWGVGVTTLLALFFSARGLRSTGRPRPALLEQAAWLRPAPQTPLRTAPIGPTRVGRPAPPPLNTPYTERTQGSIGVFTSGTHRVHNGVTAFTNKEQGSSPTGNINAPLAAENAPQPGKLQSQDASPTRCWRTARRRATTG